MFSSSHCTVPTSHVTILLSHSVVLLFASHIWWFNFILGSTDITSDYSFITFSGTLFCFSHLTVPLSHWAVLISLLTYFCHIWWYYYFFLTFDNSIVTLGNTNITFDHTFVTFGGTIIFLFYIYSFIVTLDSTNIICDWNDQNDLVT